MLVRPAAILLPLIVLLSGCGGDGKVATTTTRPVPHHPVRAPQHIPPPPAQVHVLPGTEGVIGASAAELAHQFGTARLDVWEGDARKLQFSGGACVLDVFLYPKAAGAEPRATYVDARRASDGQDVDRASCITALRQK